MSAETLEWLRENTLIGFTDKRGEAWHAKHDGTDANHFPGAVPIEAVSKLLGFELAEGTNSTTIVTDEGVTTIDDPDRKSVVRVDTGTIFGVFKLGYRIHRPQQWLIDNLNLLLDGGLQVGSALSLRGGAVVAVQAELEETRQAAEGVLHRPFLMAATSHDGSMATSYTTGTTVAVCDNTMSAALGEANALQVKVRHRSRSLSNIGKVRERLDLVVEQAGDDFDAQVKELTSRVVSEDKWQRFLERYTNPTGKQLVGRSKTMADNKRADLNRLWNYDERVAPWRGSEWGVVAAVNTFTHWEGNVKGMPREERNGLRAATGQFDKLDAGTLAMLVRA